MLKDTPIALVTGASSGIGEAISRELVKRGWKVIGIARSAEKLAALQKELSDLFLPIICDVSQKSSIDKAAQEVLSKNLCPTLFFLNAGIAGELAVENLDRFDLSHHERMMQVNYFGVLAWIEAFEKECLANGPTNFIVTSSINAIFAPPTGSAYCASKAAIAKAFESLSLTYFGTNLYFSVVYAGPVDTPGLKGNLPFTWKAEKMGRYMVDFAFSQKERGDPSLFYRVLCSFLRVLPAKYTMKILRKLS